MVVRLSGGWAVVTRRVGGVATGCAMMTFSGAAPVAVGAGCGCAGSAGRALGTTGGDADGCGGAVWFVVDGGG